MTTNQPEAKPHIPPASRPPYVRRIENRFIGGVAAGIAHRKGWSTAFVRGLFLAGLCLNGASLFLYVALWIALPSTSFVEGTNSDPSRLQLWRQAVSGNWRLRAAVALVTLGAVAVAATAFYTGAVSDTGSWRPTFYVASMVGLAGTVLLLDFGDRRNRRHDLALSAMYPHEGETVYVQPRTLGNRALRGSLAAAFGTAILSPDVAVQILVATGVLLYFAVLAFVRRTSRMLAPVAVVAVAVTTVVMSLGVPLTSYYNHFLSRPLDHEPVAPLLANHQASFPDAEGAEPGSEDVPPIEDRPRQLRNAYGFGVAVVSVQVPIDGAVVLDLGNVAGRVEIIERDRLNQIDRVLYSDTGWRPRHLVTIGSGPVSDEVKVRGGIGKTTVVVEWRSAGEGTTDRLISPPAP